MSKNLPIYVSLTSIFKNQNLILQSLQSILKQTKLPDKIFLYLSDNPSFFDNGFKDKKITNLNLLKLINDNSNIKIIWGKDIGPYGKLLPLLKYKWSENCIIITIDDDVIYDENLIKNLINDYNKFKCCICYRGFSPLFNKFENFSYKKRRSYATKLSLHNFATGKGGVLYKPEFFYKTKNLIFNHEIFLNTCDKQDDIWFYIIRVLNNTHCYIGNKKWSKKDISSHGLFLNFNSKSDNNTVSFKKTAKRLKELGY